MTRLSHRAAAAALSAALALGGLLAVTAEASWTCPVGAAAAPSLAFPTNPG